MSLRTPAPPRRFGVGDPNWKRIGPRVRVLLNGEPVTRCVSYDADKGEIVRNCTDANGFIVIDRKHGTIVRETLTGKVEVQWK